MRGLWLWFAVAVLVATRYVGPNTEKDSIQVKAMLSSSVPKPIPQVIPYAVIPPPQHLQPVSLPPITNGIPPKSLLIAVITAPTHVNAIRQVWKGYQMTDFVQQADIAGFVTHICSTLYFLITNVCDDSIELKFFIGEVSASNDTTLERDLTEELRLNPDIVRLSGFEENYFNLTRKTLGVIKWARANEYQHLFKVGIF